MTGFRPWKIVHVDLSQGLYPLHPEPGIGGVFVVIWWNDIPLGQEWVSVDRLPIRAPEFREFAIKTIAPVVVNRLIDRSSDMPCPNVHAGGEDLDLKTLAELDEPLRRLHLFRSAPPADNKDPSVSVVICTRDRPEALKQCLSSLQNLTIKPYEILVVDNAPRSKATYGIVSQFNGIRYLCEPKAGLDVARNRGITNVSGEIVAFTDDDAAVHPDWIRRIGQAFRDMSVMAVTGLLLPAELDTEAQFLFERQWGFGRGYLPKIFSSRYFERVRPLGAPVWEIGAGANMAFRRKIFDSVGLFDERLDVGSAGCSGDSEMWYRILAQGWSCYYEPDAVVYHHHRRKIKELQQQIYYYMRGHVAALLMQFQRHRHWGNLRRLMISLPWHYIKLILKGPFNTIPERERTLLAEISGCLSGIHFFLSHRKPTHPVPCAYLSSPI